MWVVEGRSWNKLAYHRWTAQPQRSPVGTGPLSAPLPTAVTGAWPQATFWSRWEEFEGARGCTVVLLK